MNGSFMVGMPCIHGQIPQTCSACEAYRLESENIKLREVLRVAVNLVEEVHDLPDKHAWGPGSHRVEAWLSEAYTLLSKR